MKVTRLLLISVAILLIIATAFAWRNWPRKVDMTQYAPADSLVYLECNDLQAVAESITTTETWRQLAKSMGLATPAGHSSMSTLALLGIGPAESVIFSRAQVAAVLVNLDATEQDTTLSIKGEGALIIETHTAGWRVRPVAEKALQNFAEKTYGQVTLKRYREDADYLEWTPASGNGKIIAAIDNSLVVVGNNKRSVQACLETKRGERKSLRNDTELSVMRRKVSADHALTFGYVSPGNATRLFSWGAPIMFGRGPGDSSLTQILAKSASKVLGPIGWSSRSSNGGIEDRFFVSLEPSVVSRLQPAFTVGPTSDSFWKAIPKEIESVTIYRAETPAHAWQALQAVSSQFDALSAVVFNSILKAALLPYGIEDPQKFMSAVGPEVATVKLNQGRSGSVLLARAIDRKTLQEMFPLRGDEDKLTPGQDLHYANVSDQKFAATFLNDYFVVGSPANVRLFLEASKNGSTVGAGTSPNVVTRFVPDSSAGIVTYSNDSERVRNFFAGIAALQGGSRTNSAPIPNERLPFATTETGLHDEGIERRTQSAFGLFSTLISLLRRE
jgi:hypothetical protein